MNKSLILGAALACGGIVGQCAGAEGRLSSALLVNVAQSSDASPANTASAAVDGANTTWGLTANTPGSWWTATLGRPYLLSRIELVNRPAPDDLEMADLTLQLFNMDDQAVFQTNLVNPGPGATYVLNLPAGLSARSIWIGLPGTQTNGAGTYRVGLAEVRLFGLLNLPYAPEPILPQTNGVSVWQSSEYGGFPAANAVDGNTGSFTHTANLADSCWMADLGREVRLDRVEIVNRLDCCSARLAKLVLRIFDASSNSVASAVLTDPGLGATWTRALPAGTQGRWIRVGLENGGLNGDGNHYVTLAEARAFSGTTNVLSLASGPPVPVTNNLASFKNSYMLRLDSSVPAATNANDNNYSTETHTTWATVDGYWEVDLGATYALYSVRAIAASGVGYRLTNTTVRLYDAGHDSVFARKVSGTPDAFDVDLNGPIFARYVRVGLEDKQRTDPNDGIEFYIGFREVEVFGCPTNGIGILSFTASTNQVNAGESVTLSWSVEDVRRVEIHPGPGSVGAYTATSGVGRITIPVSNSTEFVLVASNAAGIFARGASVQVASNALPVRLSEIVAENRYSLKDGYGDASDWIELRNTGNSAVDLAGWGLSDDPAQPMKWTLPSTNLAPHSTLIVFASGRNTPFDPAGYLHASFRLDKNGGAVILTASDGVTTVDSLGAYPELDTDLAYGRDLEDHWTFIEPTPGAANAAPTYLGWIKQLDWSHARGFYETGFTLTLTNNSPGATVLYSLDGSAPTLAYSGGLAISGTRAVRAQAVRAGYKPARLQTKTFLFLSDVIASPVMNPSITQSPTYASRMRPGLLALPSISICVPGQPEYQEQEGSIEVLWPDGSNPVQANCGILRFGNAWTRYAKRSIRMKCRSRYGDAKLSAPLFNGFGRGVPAQTSFDELDFRSGSQDMYERGFYMAESFVEDSMLEMGSLNPHGRFVHLYLNGVYWGQYDCRELLVEHFLADYLGGAAEDYVAVRGNDNVGDDFVLGAPEPPNIQPWEQVRAWRSSFNSVRPYLDVSHLVDFMLLWNYGICESEYRACGPIKAGSGFKFWIADADGFLQTSALGQNRTVRNGPGDLVSGLLGENNSDFKTLLADRIYKHFFNNGALTPARNTARLAARMQEVNDSLLVECARWGYRTPSSWVAAAATIRTSLFPTRTTELLGYLRSAGWFPSFDPPTFSQYGGVVTNGYQPQLSSSSGTLYFTLDGTDPRLSGGAVSPAAQVWVNGILTITRDLTLSVRLRNASGQWSALAQPQFVLGPARPPGSRNLLITEINYNAPGSDDSEFVELYNAGPDPLDLSGVSLTNAVRYTFPANSTLAAGAFVCVVKDTNAFAQLYQDAASPYYYPGVTVAGPWSGSLDNAGETLSLLASNGLALATISYKSSGDWPERANGLGSSLELRVLPPPSATEADVRAFVADGMNWTSSSLYHGSPGRFDGFVKSIRINELLSNAEPDPDWVELLNTGAQPVELTGCTLTDNYDLPVRYAFPSGTVLQPGQSLVLTAPQLGFGFGAMGELAALLQMSGTNVVRFLDTVDFPAAAPGESFGRCLRSDGEFDFTELSALTPGAANAPPRVGPVVISEIMSQPAPGLAEFIELTSLTNSPVSLFDPLRPTNVWTIEGVGSFAFPTGTVMPPLSTLVVCSTNPAAFRTQYGLSDAVLVFGPWSGNLGHNGETLKLLRPGEPETNGAIPYYRVDHVTYRPDAPWPPAAPGVSLQRTPLQGYGNDPLNWAAAAPTPGANPAPGQKPVILTAPQNQVADEGQPVSFSVLATGVPPLTYQWRFNGIALVGATNAILSFESAQVSQAGAYDVLVFSPGGSVLSPSAWLSVHQPPVILLQPASQGVRLGSNAFFTVVAAGSGALRYQWRFNGSPVGNATNSTLNIPVAGPEHVGVYTVMVTGSFGSVLSDPATLSLLADPVIVQQPLSQPVLAGDSVTLSVAVTNIATLPINYRWRRSGATFTNFFLNSHISFLTITNVRAPYTNWSVLVTNVVKPAGIFSSNAYLVLLADTNANSLPDAWEAAWGFGPGHPALRDDDPDGDLMSNWQEYIAGTDPGDASSCLRVELTVVAGDTALLRFSAVSNRTYSVFFTGALVTTNAWVKLADVVAGSATRLETVPDPDWTTNRFYRVVTPRQP